MLVSRQSNAGSEEAARGPLSGPRARTGRLMLETAIRLMQSGATPSVSEVAEAAGVSRATAYRYFPSQAALVGAVVDEGLGPILTWTSTSQDPARRVAELIEYRPAADRGVRGDVQSGAETVAGTVGAWPRRHARRGAGVQARPSDRSAQGRARAARRDAGAGKARPPRAGAVAGLWGRSADRSQGYLGAGWSRNAICGSMGGKRACPCRFGRGCRRDAEISKAGLGHQLVRPDFAI